MTRPIAPARAGVSSLTPKAPVLLPCPFCGSENVYTETVAPHTHKVATFMPDYEGGSMATCGDCCAAHWRDGKGSEAKVIAAWNRRPGDEP